MSKLIIFLLLITAVSCTNAPSAETKANAATDATAMSTPIAVKNTATTLDSLQGTWVSVQDSKSKVQFTKDMWHDIYDGKPIDPAHKVFLVNECVAEGKVTSSNTSGSVIVLEEEGRNMCYTIDFLSDTQLSLFYDNHTLSYQKKK
jgi:hypothetical protein